VEQGERVVAARAPHLQPGETRERVLDDLTRQAKPVVSWMLSARTDSDDFEAERLARKDADTWATYLLEERPSILSAIFLILLFGWPLVVAFGAFDLYSSDIGSRQLRYQLLRTDRGSIYTGRLIGMVLTFVLVLLLLGATVTLYIGLKLPVYSWPALLAWSAYGVLALIVASLPYVALCAWVSACFGSAFGSLTISSLVIGGVPLFAMLGRNTHEAASYLNYVLPWGFQTHLFDHRPANVALAIGGCALQTALFAWLGYRKFTTRDL
jgi:ABC-type transport system involved in multi-copper enzyme maturation permease subunit